MNAETRKRGARSESAREKEQEQEGSNEHGYACCSVPPWMGDDMCARALPWQSTVSCLTIDWSLNESASWLLCKEGGRERET